MKASVIISFYNEKLEWIIESITSIRHQTFTDFEVIMVLDNPERTDIRDYLQSVVAEDLRFQLVENEKNIGIVKSLNKALQLAKGEFIFRMDADDVSELTRFEKQIDFMETEQIDFSSTAVRITDEAGNEKKITHYEYPTVSDRRRLLPLAMTMCHPAWCVKSEVYEKLGGYRQISYAEDYDFVLRALKTGYRLALLPEVLLNYRERDTSISQGNLFEQAIMLQVLRDNASKIDSVSVIELKAQLDNYIDQTDKQNYQTFFESDLSFTRKLSIFLREKMVRKRWLRDKKLRAIKRGIRIRRKLSRS